MCVLCADKDFLSVLCADKGISLYSLCRWGCSSVDGPCNEMCAVGYVTIDSILLCFDPNPFWIMTFAQDKKNQLSPVATLQTMKLIPPITKMLVRLSMQSV
jgi:hypothetical protein